MKRIMMKKVMMFVGALLVASFAQADALPVVDATFVRGGSNADTVYTSTTLDLKNAGTNYCRIAIMKIDVSSVTGEVTTASFQYYKKSTVANTLHVYGVVASAGGQDWDGTTATWNSMTESGLFNPQPDMYLTASTNNPTLVEIGSYHNPGNGGTYIYESVSGSALVNLINSHHAVTSQWLSVVFVIEDNVSGIAVKDHTVASETQLEISYDPVANDPLVYQIGGEAGQRDSGWSEATYNATSNTVTRSFADSVDGSLVFTITAKSVNTNDVLSLASAFIGVDSSARTGETNNTDRINGDEQVILSVSYVGPLGGSLGMSGAGPYYGNLLSETTTVTDALSQSYDFVEFPNEEIIQGNWGTVITGLQDLTKNNAASWTLTYSAGDGATTAVGGFAIVYFRYATPLQAYNEWAEVAGLTETNNAFSVDAEGDGMGNLFEYGVGGDPLADDAATFLPIHEMGAEGGTNYMNLVYRRRINPDLWGVTYDVFSATDLVFDPITNATDEAGAVALDEDFESVTNRISTDVESKQFMQLIITGITEE